MGRRTRPLGRAEAWQQEYIAICRLQRQILLSWRELSRVSDKTPSVAGHAAGSRVLANQQREMRESWQWSVEELSRLGRNLGLQD